MAPGLQSIALFSQIVVDHAEGCTIADVDGNEYLDFIAGIAVGSVGHGHPHYIKRLREQLERSTFGSFTTEARVRFLKIVASLLPLRSYLRSPTDWAAFGGASGVRDYVLPHLGIDAGRIPDRGA